jgi:hypothetical protein
MSNISPNSYATCLYDILLAHQLLPILDYNPLDSQVMDDWIFRNMVRTKVVSYLKEMLPDEYKYLKGLLYPTDNTSHEIYKYYIAKLTITKPLIVKNIIKFVLTVSPLMCECSHATKRKIRIH